MVQLYARIGRSDLAIDWYKSFKPTGSDDIPRCSEPEDEAVFLSFVASVLEKRSQNLSTAEAEDEFE